MGHACVYNRSNQSVLRDNLTIMGNRKKEQAETKTGVTPEDGKFSLISNQKLIALYTNLLKWRRDGELNGNFAAMRGREAGVVGTQVPNPAFGMKIRFAVPSPPVMTSIVTRIGSL